MSCVLCQSGWYSATLCARPEDASAAPFTLYTVEVKKRKRVGRDLCRNLVKSLGLTSAALWPTVLGGWGQ